GLSARVESSTKEQSLDEEDASKHGRNIADINAYAETTLVNETAEDQGRYNDQEMFDTGVLDDEEVFVEKAVAVKEVNATQDQVKDKGEGKMVEPEMPLKKKAQVSLDEELAFKLQDEQEEEEKIAKEKALEANIAEWDDVQAMMDADCELAMRLQEEEQGELAIEEKLRLFMELMDKRKKHFAKLRAEEKRRKPATKAQKRNQMYVYLKNMIGFTHTQLKNKSFDEVQRAFDKTTSWINSFVPMES
nr:hypothetical protein [Tanacetum cinerariifolium]